MNPLTSIRFWVQFPILQRYSYFLILQIKLPHSSVRTGLVVNSITPASTRIEAIWYLRYFSWNKFSHKWFSWNQFSHIQPESLVFIESTNLLVSLRIDHVCENSPTLVIMYQPWLIDNCTKTTLENGQQNPMVHHNHPGYHYHLSLKIRYLKAFCP
jgi:hypothetical protein